MGNGPIALLFVVGVATTVANAFAGRFREAWLVLAPPALGLAFLSSFFIHYGRNYLPFLAFACVVAGVGGSRLLDVVLRAWPRRPYAAWAAGAILMAAILPIGRHCLLGTGPFAEPPNAREQAIAWANTHAPLGSKVVIVEPDLGRLDGVTVDPRRFRVRRLPKGIDLRGVRFDFAIRSGDQALPEDAEGIVFSGPGRSSLPGRYVVMRGAQP